MLERKELYKKYGYDQDAGRNFILEKALPLQEPVLEIGTGKGHMTALLAKHARKVLAVDKTAEEQELARLNVAAEIIRVCRKKIVIADFNQEGFKAIRKVHHAEGREHEECSGDFSIVGKFLEDKGFCVTKHNGFCQEVYVGGK
ncbi:MAG: hypothetical protein ABIH69_05700 [bacterium]|nr:methyltransferase domain-containing protein [Candidatus Margulisiibacteriota bacterium]